MIYKNNSFFHSVAAACHGLFYAFKTESNIRRHVFFSAITILLGFYFSISWVEWCICLLCISMVITAELLNTAIENMLDILHPDYHPGIGMIKNICASAVLISSIGAFAIANIVFLPKMLLHF